MILTIITMINRKKNQKNKYANYSASRSTNSSKSTKKSIKNENRTALHNRSSIIEAHLKEDKIGINNNYEKSNKILITAPDSINDLR